VNSDSWRNIIATNDPVIEAVALVAGLGHRIGAPVKKIDRFYSV
jgi:hypothetical protein